MVFRALKRPVVVTTLFVLVVLSVFYTSKSSSQISTAYITPSLTTGHNVEKNSETNNNKLKTFSGTKTEEEKSFESSSESSERKKEVDVSVEEGKSTISITPFMPKMENATLKADLGRSTWKLLHNVLARYPDHPTAQEKTTLKEFFQIFVKVYPCGDCATHFQKLLDKYPPQVENKQTAALWGCHIHNKVNERLHKPIYDCTDILNDYDCGCGGEDEDDEQGFKDLSIGSKNKKPSFKVGIVDTTSGLEDQTKEHLDSIKIETKEELQRGG